MAEFKKDSELTLKDASSFRCMRAVEWKLQGFAKAKGAVTDPDYLQVIGQLTQLKAMVKSLFDKYGK